MTVVDVALLLTCIHHLHRLFETARSLLKSNSVSLPRARMREGVKQFVLSVCQFVGLSVCQFVSLSVRLKIFKSEYRQVCLH